VKQRRGGEIPSLPKLRNNGGMACAGSFSFSFFFKEKPKETTYCTSAIGTVPQLVASSPAFPSNETIPFLSFPLPPPPRDSRRQGFTRVCLLAFSRVATSASPFGTRFDSDRVCLAQVLIHQH
jgi:hypothetical protein